MSTQDFHNAAIPNQTTVKDIKVTDASQEEDQIAVTHNLSVLISQAAFLRGPKQDHKYPQSHYYVKMTCDEQVRTSRTICNDPKPMWGARFDVVLKEQLPEYFTLEFYDSNSPGGKTELVNSLEYKVTEDDYIHNHEANVWKNLDKGGSVQISVFAYKEENVPSEMVRKRGEVTNAKGLMSITVGKISEITIHTSKLKRPVNWVKRHLRSGDSASKDGHYCFLVLELGETAFKTQRVPIDNPVFNKCCRFWVPFETASPVLRISLFVDEQLLGRAYVSFDQILDEGGLLESSITFNPADEVVSDKSAKELIRNARRASATQLLSPLDSPVHSPSSSRKNLLDTEPDEKLDAATVEGCVMDYTLQFDLYDQIERWFHERLLDEFDENKDGVLNDVEFEAAMTAIDQPIDNIERIFKDLDLDRNGTLDKDELMTYLRSPAFSCRPMTYSLLSFLADGQLGLDQLISSSYSNVATLGGKKNKSLLAVQDGDSIKTGLLMIQDRKTGLLMEEHVPKFVKMALNLMYRDGLGKKLVYRKRVNNLLKSMSEKEGRKMDHPHSKKKIHSFVAQHSLDVDELLLPLDTECTNYPNFNEFFYRKLKPGARPLASSDDDSVLVSPADCRLMAFDTIDRATNLWVKGRNFSVATVLTEAFSDVFPKFDGGSMCIARLAPQDYHRWHFPVAGKLGRRVKVDGPLYTVNPVAIKEKLDVYPANKREICEVHTKDFGLVMMVCVGATMVGSINITAEDGSEVKRGDEHGYFAFGGSTVVIFFEKNRVKFDSDLLLAASRPVETLVTVGMKIGVAVSEQGKN